MPEDPSRCPQNLISGLDAQEVGVGGKGLLPQPQDWSADYRGIAIARAAFPALYQKCSLHMEETSLNEPAAWPPRARNFPALLGRRWISSGRTAPRSSLHKEPPRAATNGSDSSHKFSIYTCWANAPACSWLVTVLLEMQWNRGLAALGY